MHRAGKRGKVREQGEVLCPRAEDNRARGENVKVSSGEDASK